MTDEQIAMLKNERENTYIIAGKFVHLSAETHEYCEKETLSDLSFLLPS